MLRYDETRILEYPHSLRMATLLSRRFQFCIHHAEFLLLNFLPPQFWPLLLPSNDTTVRIRIEYQTQPKAASGSREKQTNTSILSSSRSPWKRREGDPFINTLFFHSGTPRIHSHCHPPRIHETCSATNSRSHCLDTLHRRDNARSCHPPSNP